MALKVRENAGTAVEQHVLVGRLDEVTGARSIGSGVAARAPQNRHSQRGHICNATAPSDYFGSEVDDLLGAFARLVEVVGIRAGRQVLPTSVTHDEENHARLDAFRE